MGQVAGKATSMKIVDQAKSYRTDQAPLDQIRATLRETGSMVTYRPAKGNISYDRHVFAGDLSAEDNATMLQVRPLLTLEYNRGSHSACIKHGVTGDVVMMLVRELSDDPWWGTDDTFRCGLGGQTEARLYANGRPVSVVLGKQFMDAAPSPQVNGEDRPQLGASMVELIRAKEGNSLMFYRRKKDNTRGTQVGGYTKVRNAAVFKMVTEDIADPIVLIVMAWFVSIEA